MLLHQSNGTLTDFRRKFVVLAHGSIFSKVGASSKPGAIQFEQLADKVAALLRGSRAVVATLVARFPVVVCDEHQDANAAQHRLVMCLLEGGARLRVFGDPVQAIYARGAEQELYLQRWDALKFEADRFEVLDVAHRWTDGSPALGQWILAARQALRDGGQLDLRGILPAGLSIVVGNNVAPRRGGFSLEAIPGRSFNRVINGCEELMILAAQTATVRGLNAYLGRRLPIWEGHTRDALHALVRACQAGAGRPQEIGAAFKAFVQATMKGFSDTGFANRFLAEIASNCANPCRGKPRQLQALARVILERPNHQGVACALIMLQALVSEDDAFRSLEIDLSREYHEAVQLLGFEDIDAGLAEITRRRNASRTSMPAKCISTVHKAKGHQARHAIVAPFDRTHFGNSREKRNLLYVAISRASHSLTIQLSTIDPSPLIIYP